MSVKLLTEPHFEFLSLKGGCTALSESYNFNCKIAVTISNFYCFSFLMFYVQHVNSHVLFIQFICFTYQARLMFDS